MKKILAIITILSLAEKCKTKDKSNANNNQVIEISGRPQNSIPNNLVSEEQNLKKIINKIKTVEDLQQALNDNTLQEITTEIATEFVKKINQLPTKKFIELMSKATPEANIELAKKVQLTNTDIGQPAIPSDINLKDLPNKVLETMFSNMPNPNANTFTSIQRLGFSYEIQKIIANKLDRTSGQEVLKHHNNPNSTISLTPELLDIINRRT